MNLNRKEELIRTYCDGLLNNVVPFWLKYGVDREHGGVFTCLDREGSVCDTDKSVWFQGRFAWLLSTLYQTIEPKMEWIETARQTLAFMDNHCFDGDGRMFFQVTARGEPLRKRRYAYSESFACIAYAAYARATGDMRAAARARALFRLFHEINFTTGTTTPKYEATRPMINLAPRMICLSMAQVLRDTVGDDLAQPSIDHCLQEIRDLFVKPELQAVMETVGPQGEVYDHVEGRQLCPGHAFECAWFVLSEAMHRGNDPHLIELGCQMLDIMWYRGWDSEYGGLYYFRDVYGKPVQEYWHDMKFWWPHNEAIIATLMAFFLTKDSKYSERHTQVHDWAYAHFPDEKYGEWFGYLHRDGSISQTAKGTMWKGPFHLPRMQLICLQLLNNFE